MAKKNEKETDAQAKSQELAIINATDQLVENSKVELIISVIGSNEKLNQIKDQYKGLTLLNIDDLVAYDNVCKGIKDLKKLKTDIETERTRLTAPALKFQKDMIAYEKGLIEEINPIITHLESQKVNFDDKVKAEQNKRFLERVAKLEENGYQLTGGFYICGVIQIHADNLRTLKEEEFTFYQVEGEKEMARRAAEQERKQAEEKKLQEERDNLAKEREEIRLEREEMAKLRAELLELKQDLTIQKEALETSYEKTEEKAEVSETDPSQIETQSPFETAIAETAKLADIELKVEFTPPADQATENHAATEPFGESAKGSMMAAMGKGPASNVEAPVAEVSETDPSQSISDYNLGYTHGFEAFKMIFLEYFQDESIKHTRASVVQWCQDQKK